MAYSVSPATTSPNTEFYRAFENRNPEFMQPEEGEISVALLDSNGALPLDSDNKGLKSRVVVVLSNTFRNVAIIETTRFLAIIGLVCSAVASVLLPALGFAAIAAGACVLKNRAIQLDAKTQKDSDVSVGEVFDRTLTGSASTVSQTSQGSDLIRTISREGSTRSNATISMMPITEESSREEGPTDIKKPFLNSLGDRDNLNIEDLHGLLAICYFYLLGKTADMPKSLTKEGLLSPNINTQTYFEKKFKDCFSKTSTEFQNSAKLTLDNEGHKIPAVNEKQKSLESANPSLIMEIVQELHQQISREQYRHKNKTEANHHTIKAEHAAEYIGQLRTFELQKGLHFTEDVNYA